MWVTGCGELADPQEAMLGIITSLNAEIARMGQVASEETGLAKTSFSGVNENCR